MLRSLNVLHRTLAVSMLSCAVGVSTGRAQSHGQDSIHVRFDTVEVTHEQLKILPAAFIFSNHEILTAPGTLGDPTRVLISSGDAITNSDIQAIPMIDGDAADEFLTLLDGYPISFPYRLLGIYSLFNTLTTKNIELTTSGYPVAYGGHAPSAIRVNSTTGYSPSTSIQTDLSLPISSACIRLPISDTLKCSVATAVRASHVGLVGALMSDANRKRIESFVPDLKDAQFFLTEMPLTNLYASQEVFISDEQGNLENQNRAFDYSWKKALAGASFLLSSSIPSEHHAMFTHDHVVLSTEMPIEGYGSNGYGNGEFAMDAEFTTWRWQSHGHLIFSPVLESNAGADVLYERSSIRFNTFSSWLNYKSPVQSTSSNTAAYADVTWHCSDYCSTTIGGRATYFGFVGLSGFEPRWEFHAELRKNIHLDLSAGEYLQSPSDFHVLYGFLNFLAMPDQTPRMMIMSDQRNHLNLERHFLGSAQLHSVVLAERNCYWGIDLSGYVKQTQDLVLPARYPGIFTPLDTLSFEPLQTFQAKKSGCGISTFIQFPQDHWSLTASLFTHHSRIVDTRTMSEYRDVGDIPVLAKILLEYAPAGWTIDVLYQYSSGIPTTEQYYVQSITSDLYLHLWKTMNASRLPAYQRMDITATKSWNVEHWNLALSFGAVNVLGRRNVSNYIYELSPGAEDNMWKKTTCSTIPFLPVLNVKAGYTW